MANIPTLFILLKWRAYFLRHGLPLNKQKQYISYIEKLVSADLPILIDEEHITETFGTTKDSLNRMKNEPEKFYYEFHIPKRRKDEYRRISSPHPWLLQIQRWINSQILAKGKIHNAAHGFIPGRSIFTNASLHVGQNALLKMDIHNFFPSIAKAKVSDTFHQMGYFDSVSETLTGLCSLNDGLPQGAATSPTLSNLIFYEIDKNISEWATLNGLVYSRYADDLTFSGESIDNSFGRNVESIIQNNGFSINAQKTRLITKGRKIVTGLSVYGSQIKIPRNTKRQIRKSVHDLLKKGPLAYMQESGDWDPLIVERLNGQLQFWRQAEPDNNFVQKAIDKLNTSTFEWGSEKSN